MAASAKSVTSIKPSSPLSTASQTLPEKGNLGECAAAADDEKNDPAAPNVLERIHEPSVSADLVHHHGDKVCEVEMVPVHKRKLHNVLTRMNDERLRGPLGVMRRCMTENIKVKVITRNYKHVRGICTGFILAFDKHWNLVLKDVDEVYKNPLPEPTAKRKKRQRKTKGKMLKAVPDGKDLSQDERKKSAAKLESASGLLCSDFDITDSPTAEDDVRSYQEQKRSTSVESLREKRKCILERLQELSCAAISSSEYESNEVEDLKRCSDAAFTKQNVSRVSRDERRSSASSATGSKESERSKTRRSRKSYKKNKWKSSRTDDSDLSSRDRDQRVADCGRMQEKNLCGKSFSAETQSEFRGMLSKHSEPVYRVTQATETGDLDGVNQCKLAQKNRLVCDESQKPWQSWLVRHVNQLFVRGDNVVLVSVNET